MKKGTFEGTSTNGSIEEAIINAINAAKHDLKSEMVSWKLDTLSGQNGGIAQTNMVTVSLKVKTMKAKKEEKVKEVKVKEVKEEKVKEVKTTPVKAPPVKTKAKAKK
jgi:hypothetical protein